MIYLNFFNIFSVFKQTSRTGKRPPSTPSITTSRPSRASSARTPYHTITPARVDSSTIVGMNTYFIKLYLEQGCPTCGPPYFLESSKTLKSNEQRSTVGLLRLQGRNVYSYSRD